MFRPVIIRLSGDPVPGICVGLRKGLEGMRVGGKRTFVVPPGVYHSCCGRMEWGQAHVMRM